MGHCNLAILLQRDLVGAVRIPARPLKQAPHLAELSAPRSASGGRFAYAESFPQDGVGEWPCPD